MANRILGGLITLLIAGAATLPLAGVAHADEAEPVSGECAATLLDENGEPLTVDADALVGDLGVPAVRLGTPTERQARKAQSPAVEVPIGDVVEGLGVSDAPLLGDAADAACGAVDGAAATVNRVGQTTKSVAAAGLPASLPDPVQQIDPEPVDEGDDGAQTPGVVAPVVDKVPASALRPPLGRYEYFGFERFPAGPLPTIPVPPAAAAQNGPDLMVGGRSDDLAASNAGHAIALPEAPIQQPQRAPFVLAVGLLAVVAAVLVRRWITRSVS